MKKTILIFSFITNLFAFDTNGYLQFEEFFYKSPLNINHNKESIYEANFELKNESQSDSFFANLILMNSNIDKNKDYIDLKEIYYKYYSDDYEISMGKNVLFWGNLEGYNFIDTFNLKNISKYPYSPFEKANKYGSVNVNYKYYTEEGFLSLLLKLKEEENILGEKNSVYNPFSLEYNKNLLHQGKEHSLGVYLLYKDYLEKFDTDYFFKYQYSYNDKRDFLVKNNQIREYAYNVQKIGFYSTTNLNEVLYKTQISFTDSKYINVKDYYQTALGVEKLISYEKFSDIEMIAILEYYYSNAALNIENFQNDLFIGLRIDPNDAKDTKISLGTFYDVDNSDSLLQGKLERRLEDNIKIEALYTYIDSDYTESPFYFLDQHQSFKFLVKYYF